MDGRDIPPGMEKCRLQRIGKIRGVKGAASCCALAAIGYLAARSLLQAGVSFLMGLRVEGASLSNPVGFSPVEAELLAMVASVAAILLPILILLRLTRLRTDDLRLLLPAPWSPAFCTILFLGVANAGNLFGGLLGHLLGRDGAAVSLPAGGAALAVNFISLCVVPAILEELFFRGALQGLMRPCGSAAAIFAPALLFALLHLDLAQGITAFLGGLFLGWLAERTGSILPCMLLHLINNTIAFADIYLQLYAPGTLATAVELAILLGFPLLAGWLVWRAVTRQGFSFEAGLRPGAEIPAVFSSPAYTLAAAALAVLTLWQSFRPN